ncbi:hypothetical protein BGX34_010939 [Mortierella sp. NVP85]|nr:hypothetical protein BGX34_010939 [Mortierella sp. NVP85]
MRFSIFAVAAAIVSTVLAQNAAEVFPTAPIGSTVWLKSSSEYTIRWTVNPQTSADTELKIELLTGPNAQSQAIVQELGTVKAGAKKFTVTNLDKSLASGWYTIRLQNSYTAPFQIKDSSKESLTATAPGAVTTTTVAVTTVATTASTAAPKTTTAASSPTPSPNAASSLFKSGCALTFSAAVAVAAALL